MNKKIWKKAFIRSIPILFSYLFVGTAYGMMMQQCFYVDHRSDMEVKNGRS